MPKMDGIEATRRLLADPDAPKVVVLTTFDNDEYVMSAIRAGASGFLLKDVPPEQLLDAIRTVHRGDAVIEARATRRLLQHVGPLLEGSAPEAQLPEELTPREVEVLEAMAYGLSNSEIAAKFHVSETTVKTHVGRSSSPSRSDLSGAQISSAPRADTPPCPVLPRDDTGLSKIAPHSDAETTCAAITSIPS
eukprot:gene22885-27444_t